MIPTLLLISHSVALDRAAQGERLADARGSACSCLPRLQRGPSLIGNVAKKSNIQRGFLVAAASSVVFLGFVVFQFLTQ